MYWLISVQIYRRRDGQWWVDSIGPGGRLHLASVNLNCPIEALYQDLSAPLTAGSTASADQP